MGGMDEMMEAMIGGMSREERQAMMEKMMDKFFAGMTAEDRQQMMERMMPKMMEGINMAEMMPKMMMGMMGRGGKAGPGRLGAPHMAHGHHPEGPPMMGHMMTQMMPGCVDMMLPGMPKEERADFVLDMISRLMEKGTAGMSEEEKSSLVARALERITSL
jgi:hypothetical protein